MAPAPRAESGGGGLEGTALQDHGSEYVRFFKEFNENYEKEILFE